MCKTERTDWEATAMMHISLKLEAWKAIERVRELHKPEPCDCGDGNCSGFCVECSTDGSGIEYPCDTIKALEGEQ